MNLYKFYWDCGRQGSVEGIFFSTPERIQKNLGNQVYFGEILGKHSEISGILEEEDVTLVTDDQDFVEKFRTFFPGGFGYDPFEAMSVEDEDDVEEELEN